MRKLDLPVGISNFAEIRKNGYYYVDKSGLIVKLLQEAGTAVTLITRPRRFGKTMGMNMLANFFDLQKDSRALFEGLEVSREPALCARWMNQWPTLFLSFKDVDGTCFENAFNLLKFTLSLFCDAHPELAESDKVTQQQRRTFARLIDQTASLTEVQGSLLTLMQMMQATYGKPVILLLDEYDVPLAKAGSNGYYPEMLEVIKTMMSTALKDNPALQLAVVTGCLRIAKESIFTGVNNFVSDTISHPRLNEYFGFTQAEVDRLLQAGDAADHAGDLKAWYDGYHFGDLDVYCPWDVMNYLRDLQNDPEAEPANYWENTSDNAIIRSFIDYAGDSISEKLETLLAGGHIIQTVQENLTYDALHSSEENLWSVLYLTGYLTRVPHLPQKLPRGTLALAIPNAEVKEIFEHTIQAWFHDTAQASDRRALFGAVWSGDAETLTEEMSDLLYRTISYHDYREDFYHAFLAGIFAGAGYIVTSNREHGKGRSDVVVWDKARRQVAVFEAKYSKIPQDMEKDCARALRQIEENQYAKDYMDRRTKVFCYGIAFCKKDCLVQRL